MFWDEIVRASDQSCGIFLWRGCKNDSDVSIDMNYDVVSSSSWSESICNPETHITRVRGPLKSVVSFQSWTPWTCVDKPPLAPISPQRKFGLQVYNKKDCKTGCCWHFLNTMQCTCFLNSSSFIFKENYPYNICNMNVWLPTKVLFKKINLWRVELIWAHSLSKGCNSSLPIWGCFQWFP